MSNGGEGSMKTRKLRLVSDGTTYNSRLIDVESGEVIDQVMKVTVRIDGSTNFVPVADITFFNIDLDLVVDVANETTIGPKEIDDDK
jgi:hypothetical protein